jgi:hypothetical protein
MYISSADISSADAPPRETACRASLSLISQLTFVIPCPALALDTTKDDRDMPASALIKAAFAAKAIADDTANAHMNGIAHLATRMAPTVTTNPNRLTVPGPDYYSW